MKGHPVHRRVGPSRAPASQNPVHTWVVSPKLRNTTKAPFCILSPKKAGVRSDDLGRQDTIHMKVCSHIYKSFKSRRVVNCTRPITELQPVCVYIHKEIKLARPTVGCNLDMLQG